MITKTELYTGMTASEVLTQISELELDVGLGPWAVRQIVVVDEDASGPGRSRSQRPPRGAPTQAYFVVYEKES